MILHTVLDNDSNGGTVVIVEQNHDHYQTKSRIELLTGLTKQKESLCRYSPNAGWSTILLGITF